MRMNDFIRLAGIVNDSIVDGPGFRMAIFTQGCPHRCEGCHNPHTHDPAGGEDHPIDDIISKFDKNTLLSGVTFTGGEPFLHPEPLCRIARHVRSKNKNVIIYTGYLIEELLSSDDPYIKNLLGLCDLLIDGRFERDKKDYRLKFRGSSNQRVIDLPETLRENRIIEKQFE